jgi:Bacteriophage tail sheath protein
MPSALTYPGVYIEELRSGVRTITGVATSITAFVGRAARGPVGDPITITSFADFQRTFGGLWEQSAMGFAVRDFFQNGGSLAIIVRLYREGADDATATIDANGLGLEAASPGTWGNALRARVDHDVAEAVAESFGLQKTALFNLTIRDTKTGVTEQFRNLTVADSPRLVDRVLENESELVVVPALPGSVPTADGTPAPGDDIWADDSLSSPVDVEGSDGDLLNEDIFIGGTNETDKKGLYALDHADLFNLLCIPPHQSDGNADPEVLEAAATYCERRRAMLIVDSPVGWNTPKDAVDNVDDFGSSKNAAIFFPRLRRPNPLHDGQIEDFAPSGAVAGVFARTDAQRGVWKAPAGLDATLVGAPALSVPLTDAEVGLLNPIGVNCLRAVPAAGRVVWGARTRQGDDRLTSEWKYIPVRRTALFIEESLYRGTQWVVFEPNDEPLWSQIRLNVGAFMQNLFRQGAFQGATPQQAYLVKCDGETTTQTDINLGVVNILVGFAPLKPAEFVVIKIQQLAGQIEA